MKTKMLGLLVLCFVTSASCLVITSPSNQKDWRELACLLVETFDEKIIMEKINSNENKSTFQSKLELVQWNLIERSLTEQYNFNQYVQTAKKMKGKKYSLFLAKEYNPGCKEKEIRPFYETVGMIEIGMTLEPSTPSPIDPSLVSDECIGNRDKILIPRATVGVLCVKSTAQNNGVGHALLQRCEQVIVELWDEDEVFVEVEPNNLAALSFFNKHGYLNHHGEMRNATVSSRRNEEKKPHYVLRKLLTSTKNETIESSSGYVNDNSMAEDSA